MDLYHWEYPFDCVIIACCLEFIRPGLVQGYKAPQWCEMGLLDDNLLGVRPIALLNSEHSQCVPVAPAGTQTPDFSQATI